MELLFNRLEKKYVVQEMEIQEENLIMLIELFVRDNLSDEGVESFYAELEGKEINEQSVKDALFKAILCSQLVTVMREVIQFYKGDISEKSFVEHEANKALNAIREEEDLMNK